MAQARGENRFVVLDVELHVAAGQLNGERHARMVKKDKLSESQWKRLVNSGGVLDENKRTWYPSAKSLKGSALQNPGAI